ncbi:uncharacterized protein LOC135478126 [Liolophura sinensis]|uniref:uncharacterized protein LOC135478126 n=1 Tax=Liolophura sinensis TaxID=3198878 RepID=UPI00315972D4
MVRNKFERTLSQAVPVTTDSILSIVTSSTDENFRQACFASLQVNNARDLRRLLSEKLFTLATDKYQCNADSEPHCQDSPSQKSHDQDSFDDLGVHEEGIETKADTNWESSNIEFYGNSDCTGSVEPEPWTDYLLYTEQHNNLDTKDTNAKEDRESSSQEWYNDSHGDLDNWMEE